MSPPSNRYTPSTGYGWLSGSIDERDRGPVNGTNDLTEDFNFTANGVFTVDLPDGTYNVTVTLGDADYAHGPMSIALQGVPVDTVTTDADQFVTRSYRATVTSGAGRPGTDESEQQRRGRVVRSSTP